jgi:hypothetical protein
MQVFQVCILECLRRRRQWTHHVGLTHTVRVDMIKSGLTSCIDCSPRRKNTEDIHSLFYVFLILLKGFQTLGRPASETQHVPTWHVTYYTYCIVHNAYPYRIHIRFLSSTTGCLLFCIYLLLSFWVSLSFFSLLFYPIFSLDVFLDSESKFSPKIKIWIII